MPTARRLVPGWDAPLPDSGRAAVRAAPVGEGDVVKGPVRVLLVEDEPAHAELARRAFETRPGTFVVAVAQTLASARRTLSASSPPDVVIADWRLPDGDGIELLRTESPEPLPPVVIMTSFGSERIAVEVMRAGAVDYVVKSDVGLADLPHVAERALRQRGVEEALADIVAGTTGTGEAFFQSIVLRLARALRVKYASVAERVDGNRLRTLARCVDGDLVDNVEYPLAGSPCAGVIDGTVCYVRHGVAEQFPGDEGLRRLGAESYVGLPLLGADGSVRGLVNAIHDRPLQELVQPEAVVRVFASRAAAEMLRREAEDALERQRLFAESLLDMVASLVIVVDPQGRVVRFNRACEVTSGWTEAELKGRHFWEVLHPPEAREEVARDFSVGRSSDDLAGAYEAEWLTRSGERRLLSWVRRSIRDEQGRTVFVIGTGFDVTESRRIEAALRASEERYRTLMRHAPEAVLVADVDRGGLLEDANANAERLFGIERERLESVPSQSLLPDLQPDGTASEVIARRLFEEALAGGNPVAELVYRVAGGEERLCEVRVVRLPGPGRLIRLSIIDIAERKRLEADLRRAAVEWRQTFDGLPLGVVVVDAEGRVVRANRAAVECSGRRSWADLIDRRLADVAPGEPWAALAALVAPPGNGAHEPREVTDALSRRTWVVGASRLATDGEGPGRVVLNFQDVTATAQLKEQLRQTETMAAIGSIVAGVAHEVRNPLFSISATLDAFDARFGRTEGYEKYLGVLRGEISRLTTLMKDLLEFGRPSRPDLGTCHVEDAIRAAVHACGPLARRQGVEVAWTVADGVPPVLADRGRLVQVLQNLVENAVYFSPRGGTVGVGVEWRAPTEEEWVEVSVRDSGPGFAAADLPRLFEPFFTRRRGGTGLGLSIVRRIVYDHGGEVFAWNHPEGGAVVAVRLRRARA